MLRLWLALASSTTSRAENCYDNAVMESSWSTFESDNGLDETIPASCRHDELATFVPIETFYNLTKRHISLGYLSPVVFEENHQSSL